MRRIRFVAQVMPESGYLLAICSNARHFLADKQYIAKTLIENDNLPQKNSAYGLSLRFIKAIKKIQLGEAEELLGKGADINAVDTKDTTALMYAAKGGSLDATMLLVRRGANINLQDASGWTATMYAAYHRRQRVAEFLVKSGADVMPRNRHGQNAQDLALSKRYLDIARMLEPPDPQSILERGNEALRRLRRGIALNRLKA